MLRLRSFENVEERIVYYVFLPCQADEFIFRISSCNALLPWMALKYFIKYLSQELIIDTERNYFYNIFLYFDFAALNIVEYFCVICNWSFM